ncbi:hypothetical protein [Bradyrhizobium sediminis]|uniref:hypothetical protein n=1 Tax=Bradyrhizobium sediminis TaxID=2840469 RepID=UPI003FA3D57E
MAHFVLDDVGLVLDHLDAGLRRCVHHLERGFQAAAMVDAHLRNHQRRVFETDLATTEVYFLHDDLRNAGNAN